MSTSAIRCVGSLIEALYRLNHIAGEIVKVATVLSIGNRVIRWFNSKWSITDVSNKSTMHEKH